MLHAVKTGGQRARLEFWAQWAAREVYEAGVGVIEGGAERGCKAQGGHSRAQAEPRRLGQGRPGSRGEGQVRLCCLQALGLSLLICRMGMLGPASGGCGTPSSGLI